MERYLSLFLVLFVVQSTFQTSTTVGQVDLDSTSFDKITNKFKASLIKFDVAFPYGDKHQAFLDFAKEAKDSDDLLVAHVGVKDYGEKENEDLAKRFNVKKDDFPVVKLIVHGTKEPISFDPSKDFTVDEFRTFVRDNAGIYLTFPGCVQVLDNVALKFMKAAAAEKQKVLTEAKKLEKTLDDKHKASGKFYLTVMEKILEKGNGFIDSETERLKKLLTGKVSEEKKTQISHRLNIVQTFQQHDKTVKEEL